MSNPKTLLRESEWLRVFKVANESTYIYESKFLMDGLHISLSELKDKWIRFSLLEKAEFSSAFSAQPPRDNNDEAILQFLVDAGPEEVWRNIATLMAFHPRPNDALLFLIERITSDDESKANYYQAIELLHGSAAIPVLRRNIEEYRILIGTAGASIGAHVWVEYLQCAKSLFMLTQDENLLVTLKEAEKSIPAEIHRHLQQLLLEIERTKR